jgi:hypothetical protein
MATSVLYIIAAVWVLVLAFVIPLVLASKKKRRQAREAIEKKLDKQKQFLNTYESRLAIVRSHAIDYLNSLGSEGARIMSEMQGEVAKMNMLADEVRRLIDIGSTSALAQANKILEGKASIFIQDSGSGTASNWKFKLDKNWKKNLENLLQELGSNVASASQVAKDAGVPTFGKQFKRETIHDLKEAGIDIQAILASSTPPQSK